MKTVHIYLTIPDPTTMRFPIRVTIKHVTLMTECWIREPKFELQTPTSKHVFPRAHVLYYEVFDEDLTHD
jgi:hypothetical protein